MQQQSVQIRLKPLTSRSRRHFQGFTVSTTKGKGQHLTFGVPFDGCWKILRECPSKECRLIPDNLTVSQCPKPQSSHTPRKTFSYRWQFPYVCRSSQQVLTLGLILVNTAFDFGQQNRCLLHLVNDHDPLRPTLNKTRRILQRDFQLCRIIQCTPFRSRHPKLTRQRRLSRLTNTSNENCTKDLQRLPHNFRSPSIILSFNHFLLRLS